MRCADGPPPRDARWPTPLTTCCGPVPPPISDRRPEPGCLTRRPSRLATHGSVDAVRRAAPLISQHRRHISRLSGTHCRTGNRDHCAHDDTHPVVEKSPSPAGRRRPAANTLRRTSSSLRIRSQPCAPAAAGHPGTAWPGRRRWPGIRCRHRASRTSLGGSDPAPTPSFDESWQACRP